MSTPISLEPSLALMNEAARLCLEWVEAEASTETKQLESAIKGVQVLAAKNDLYLRVHEFVRGILELMQIMQEVDLLSPDPLSTDYVVRRSAFSHNLPRLQQIGASSIDTLGKSAAPGT